MKNKCIVGLLIGTMIVSTLLPGCGAKSTSGDNTAETTKTTATSDVTEVTFWTLNTLLCLLY